MRFLFPLISAVALAGCAASVPDSGAGVGFGDYDSYGRTQATTPATGLPPAGEISQETVSSATDVDTGETEDTSETASATPAPSSVEISDEQDFGAVAERETIESDSARIAANRDVYQVIEPTALPTRSGSQRPNIVAFALETDNLVGQGIYRRSRILAQSRFDRNCGQYVSADLAQEAFLAAGGPNRDRMGLDPDGDGFACYWDPAPFRAARTGTGN